MLLLIGIEPTLGTDVEAGLDRASPLAPSGRGTFFVETDELFHLYAAKSRTAGDDGRAQPNVGLVEPAAMDSC